MSPLGSVTPTAAATVRVACPECLALPTSLDACVGWRHFHEPGWACWEFVRLVYGLHCGIVLAPRATLGEGALRSRRTFARVHGRMQRYDVAILRCDRVLHAGIILGPCGAIVHVVTPTAGVVRTSWSRVAPYLTGVYRAVEG